MKDWSEKEDQIKKVSEKEEVKTNDMNIDQIKNILQEESNQNYKFPIETIDQILRQIISRFETKPEQNIEIIKQLFLLADLNYMNSKFNDSNILMNCCEKGEPNIINSLLDEKIAKKKKSNELDLFKVDKNNENILHYLFNRNVFEYDNIPIFEKIMIYATNNIKNKNKIELLIEEDKNGITPLAIILRKGWYSTLKLYFKYFEYKPHIIKSNKNNYIHCAIEGKNIKCLKLILNYCSYEELNQTNSSNLTPLAYAKEKKYNLMYELIKQFQNSFNNEEIKNVILLPKNDINQMINLFIDKKFSDVQKYLSKYKLEQIINLNIKNSNVSLEWNSLLAKKYDLFNKGLTPEHILTKFTKNNKNNNNFYQNKPKIIASLYEFNKFFNKYISDIDINDHIDEENNLIDIVIYNKIIYYYKISDYDGLLRNINLYFTHIYPQYQNNFINNNIMNDIKENKKNENDIIIKKKRLYFNKDITFVNLSFLLIEYFIKENNEQFSQIIIDELDKYFTEISPLQISSKKNKDKKREDKNEEEEDEDEENNKINSENKEMIIKYLNYNEVLNPLNSNLDDSLCYLYLLEVYFIIRFNSSKSEVIRRINKLSNIKFINEKSEEDEEKDEEEEEDEGEIEEDDNIYDDILLDNNKNNIKILNNCKQILKKVKIIMKNSNLSENLGKRFKIFYLELKSYLYNLMGNINKSISKISKIKKLLINKKPNENYSNEHRIFYYNSQGIMNLKLKKYSLAEHYFKLGINLFKSMQNDNNTYNLIEHNDIVINKSEYLFKMKFNLGLAYFHNNNFIEAYNIFYELKDIQEIKNNIFFWFKFGLSSLNLYLYSMRKIKQKNKKYYQELNKERQIDENSELNDNDENESQSIDELYEEYEKIYGKHDNLDIYLQNKTKKVNKIFIENNNKKMYEYDIDKNINNFLETSINSFKRVLNIYKKINNNNSKENKKLADLKGIYNFYTKSKGETKEFKNMINKQSINKKNNIPKSLIFSCYLNLLFAYNFKKKYLDILLLVKNFRKEKSLSNNMKRKIKYFELLALINLNRNKKAQQLIDEEIEKYGNIDQDTNNDFDCFNINDYQIEKDINHKIFLQIGQVFISCKNKKFDEAENKLLKIVENNYNGNEDISRYYYQLMVYILSSQNKKSKTIELIKHRWRQIQNNSNTFTNYYKDNNG